MEGNGAIDFAVLEGKLSKRNLIAAIEAKGSCDYIICNGKKEEISRLGMIRTDTVKKAISNTYQVSQIYPDALFFIVTSHKPESGNAKCMCDLAEKELVDKIVDISNYNDLETMVSIISKNME